MTRNLSLLFVTLTLTLPACGGHRALPEEPVVPDPGGGVGQVESRLIVERVDGYGGPQHPLGVFRYTHCGGHSFIRLYEDGRLYFGEPGVVWQRRVSDDAVRRLAEIFAADRFSDYEPTYDLGQSWTNRVGGPMFASFTVRRGDTAVSVEVIESGLEYAEWAWLVPAELLDAVRELDALADVALSSPFLAPVVLLSVIPTMSWAPRFEKEVKPWPLPMGLTPLSQLTLHNPTTVADPAQVKRLHEIFSGPDKPAVEVFVDQGQRYDVTACGALP